MARGAIPGALKRNAFAPSSVAGSRIVRAVHAVFVGYDSFPLVLGQLLLFLFGIYELMPCVVSRIKPIQEGIGLSATLFGQVNHGISGRFPPIRWYVLKCCVEHRPVRVEDLHSVQIRIRIHQLEQVSHVWQYLTRDLDWLTERDRGGLVRLVRVSSEFEK